VRDIETIDGELRLLFRAWHVARVLTRHCSMWLRLEGDSDDRGTWHPVEAVSITGFKSVSDPGLPGVKSLTVAFHDETPEVVFNETDQVEFAVPRPVHLADS
jgi:hypothetical protein